MDFTLFDQKNLKYFRSYIGARIFELNREIKRAEYSIKKKSPCPFQHDDVENAIKECIENWTRNKEGGIKSNADPRFIENCGEKINHLEFLLKEEQSVLNFADPQEFLKKELKIHLKNHELKFMEEKLTELEKFMK